MSFHHLLLTNSLSCEAKACNQAVNGAHTESSSLQAKLTHGASYSFFFRIGETESWYGLQAAPPPPPAAPTPSVAQPPEDPMGLADVVASAVPGWYALSCATLPSDHPSCVSVTACS